jgi:hypothetical protein
MVAGRSTTLRLKEVVVGDVQGDRPYRDQGERPFMGNRVCQSNS